MTSRIGPRRKLVPPSMPTGQWLRQCCLEDLNSQWLAAIVYEEIWNDKGKGLQSMLIQAGDGNDLLVLINDAEIPPSVGKVGLVLTMEVAVAGSIAEIETEAEGIIKSSDPLWPHVALARQEDPSCCIYAWVVRDSALAYQWNGTKVASRFPSSYRQLQKQKAFRIAYTSTEDSLKLNDIASVAVPEGFWSIESTPSS